MSPTERRILLVGDGNSPFITNYALWLRKQNNIQLYIDILSFSPIKNENISCYNSIFRIKDNNVIYILVNQIKGLRRIYRFLLFKKLLKKLQDYDFIHFHYINIDSCYIVEKLTSKAKIILSIWGSDMYMVKPSNENYFIQSCNKADLITFTNTQSIEYFSSKYNWKNNNLKLCRFGLAPLENLKELSTTKTECKIKLGWNPEKIAITIGYNLASGQQHLEILNQFEKEEILALKHRIHLIFPITYAGTEEYKAKLLNKLNQLPFEYTLYDKFLEDETVANIRKASDIMIQLQKTDQFSGSMQEHLYTRNVVITGSWLPYETLKKKGAWFIEIDKISDLRNLLPDVIENFDTYEEKTAYTPTAILELSSWERNIKEWIKLYQ